MKTAILSVVLVAASATAQVLQTIDPNRPVEANGKTVDMPTINFKTIPQPTRSQPVSPLSNQMRERAGNVETKNVDALKTLSYSTIPTTIVPQQNFTPKRAVADVPDKLAPAKNVDGPKAKLPPLVIRPFTASGTEELQEQFKHPR